MNTWIRTTLCLLACLCLLPATALAKRKAPAVIPPITHQGVRYTAPNDNGRVAYVLATEVASGKPLWKQTVFENAIKPELEEDVQWVFVKQMRLEGNTLVIVSENGKSYSLNLKTRQVKELKPQPNQK